MFLEDAGRSLRILQGPELSHFQGIFVPMKPWRGVRTRAAGHSSSSIGLILCIQLHIFIERNPIVFGGCQVIIEDFTGA